MVDRWSVWPPIHHGARFGPGGKKTRSSPVWWSWSTTPRRTPWVTAT